MTVEFGTIHHFSSPVGKFWGSFVQFFEQILKLTEHYVNYDILVQNNLVLNSNVNTN